MTGLPVFGEMSLEEAVKRVYGETVTVREESFVGGGCINEARKVLLSNGEALFVKSNSLSAGALFAEEARGLEALRCETGPRIPRVIGHVSHNRSQMLLLEFVESGRKRGDFFIALGSRLAELHRTLRSHAAGFSHDNFIGSSPQKNSPRDSWSDFFAEQRILFQIGLAEKNGLGDAALRRSAERLAARLPELLPEPSGGFHLLHGDLWGGNYMVGPAGEPVLIDPAVYYGHREADLAMTELFGGFPADFYRAYQESWPLEPGYRDRRDIYNLYHILNHANLFGGGYLAQSRAILRRYQ